MMNYEIATHLSGARNDMWSVFARLAFSLCHYETLSPLSLRGWLSLCVITRHFPPCLCEADVVSRSNLGGAVKEIPKKSGKLGGKPLTRRGDVIYSIRQLHRR